MLPATSPALFSGIWAQINEKNQLSRVSVYNQHFKHPKSRLEIPIDAVVFDKQGKSFVSKEPQGTKAFSEDLRRKTDLELAAFVPLALILALQSLSEKLKRVEFNQIKDVVIPQDMAVFSRGDATAPNNRSSSDTFEVKMRWSEVPSRDSSSPMSRLALIA